MAGYEMNNINPAVEAMPKNYSEVHGVNCTSYCCYTVGPGGRTNNIENNEKGMLDSIPLRLSQNVEDDSHEGGFGLRAEHSSKYQGIYTETHMYSATWPEIKTAGGEGVYDSGDL